MRWIPLLYRIKELHPKNNLHFLFNVFSLYCIIPTSVPSTSGEGESAGGQPTEELSFIGSKLERRQGESLPLLFILVVGGDLPFIKHGPCVYFETFQSFLQLAHTTFFVPVK